MDGKHGQRVGFGCAVNDESVHDRRSGRCGVDRVENVSQKVTIQETTAAAVLSLLELAAGDDVQGLGVSNVVSGCQFFCLNGLQGAEFAYALRVAGSELWIQAAGGSAAVDLTRFGLAAIESQAKGRFKTVGFQTRRRGLVAKAIKAGYEIDGYILRKKINV